jgi:hypothetical protein
MSAQKQCPKCGEKNPAEAVMCWACYTSLTGGSTGAAALAGAGGGAIGGAIGGATPVTDSGEKKSIDPKQLAIVGVGLLVALGFGVKTMMGSGDDTGGGDLNGNGPVVERPAPVAKAQTPPVIPVNGVQVPLPPVTSAQNGGNNVPAQYYRTVVSPDPKQKWGTMVIVPTEKADEAQARSYALLAKQNMDNIKKFPALEIFVINDNEAAVTLRRYHNRNHAAPLTETDFKDPELSNVWKNTIVRYMWNGGHQTFTYPSKNPDNFWEDSAGSGSNQ